MGAPPHNWSRLPIDLVNAIARKITAIDDYVRFRAVCPSWYSAAPPWPRHLPTQFPWLLLPYRADDDGSGEMVFYCPTRREFLCLPGAGMVRFCGSSHGWLLTVEENGPGTFLLNPITRAAIPLPPLSSLLEMIGWDLSRTGEQVRRSTYEIYVRRFVLSSDPAVNGDATVMVVHGRSCNLAFCKVGDDSWTSVSVPPCPPFHGYVHDVLHHRGKFYVLFGNGMLATCNLGPPVSFKMIQMTKHDGASPDGDISCQDYLVESADGNLLLISHHKSNSPNDNPFILSFTTRFGVFRVELDGRRSKISKLKSIGDNLLFLGPNDGVAISAAGFPAFQGNRIFVADSNCVPSDDEEEDADDSEGDGLPADEEEEPDDSEGDDLAEPDGFKRYDIFVFDVRDGKRKLLKCYMYDSSPGWQPPLWFTPSLCN